MSAPQDIAVSASKILTSRGKKLGPYQPLYKELAIRWTLVLGVEVTPAQTARMLVEMKLARWNAGFDEDHAIDAANYSFIAAALESESE
jgi:hypothetical protein